MMIRFQHELPGVRTCSSYHMSRICLPNLWDISEFALVEGWRVDLEYLSCPRHCVPEYISGSLCSTKHCLNILVLVDFFSHAQSHGRLWLWASAHFHSYYWGWRAVFQCCSSWCLFIPFHIPLSWRIRLYISTCAFSWFYQPFNFGTTRNEKNRCQSQNWFALLSHVTHRLLGTSSLPFRQLLETSTGDRQHVLSLSQLG